MQTIVKIAGIFKTPTEKEKFLHKLPTEFYPHSQFEVNDGILTKLKDETLKNHVVVIVETPTNLLLKVYSLIKNNAGKYVDPETLNSWELKGLN